MSEHTGELILSEKYSALNIDMEPYGLNIGKIDEGPAKIEGFIIGDIF